jgi:Ser/Thr protein kinase RdoA (MazF antagonist)
VHEATVTVVFERASYLAQVHRLRRLAEQALSRYPLRVESCQFLTHVENTTFRVTASGGKSFLLRIHRNGYHTAPAILEELRWLNHLSADQSLIVPRPVESKRGELLETVSTAQVGEARFCCLLEWVHGRFLEKSIDTGHMNNLGKLIATLHRRAQGFVVQQRRYWDAEGLVGDHPKLGTTENLPGISPSRQKLISKARQATLRKLARFQETHPERLGLIHADLHFGNILFSREQISPIDFDDCGFGFFAYDLAVPLWAIRGRQKEFERLKFALIDGYARERGWDRDDDAILASLMTARAIVLLGWINSRRDNPKLRPYFKRAAANLAKYLHRGAVQGT